MKRVCKPNNTAWVPQNKKQRPPSTTFGLNLLHWWVIQNVPEVWSKVHSLQGWENVNFGPSAITKAGRTALRLVFKPRAFFGTCQPRKVVRGDFREEESGNRYKKKEESHPSVPWGIGSRTPHGHQDPRMFKSLTVGGSATKGSTNCRWIRGLLNQRMRNLKIWRADWIWGAGGGQALQREGKVSAYVNWQKCTT